MGGRKYSLLDGLFIESVLVPNVLKPVPVCLRWESSQYHVQNLSKRVFHLIIPDISVSAPLNCRVTNPHEIPTTWEVTYAVYIMHVEGTRTIHQMISDKNFVLSDVSGSLPTILEIHNFGDTYSVRTYQNPY